MNIEERKHSACKTPLIEQLLKIPKDGRLSYDYRDNGVLSGVALIPVGRLCHEAIEHIEKLEAELENKKLEWRQKEKDDLAIKNLFEENQKLERENKILFEVVNHYANVLGYEAAKQALKDCDEV